MKPELMKPSAIQQALATVTSWRVEGGALVKEFHFSSYQSAIDFVNQVAQAAEAMNHHPEMHVGWRKVGMHVSTHSAGGLTPLDFELARRADAFQTPG